MRTRPVIFSLLDTPAFGGAEQYLLSHLIFLNQHHYPVVVATNNSQVKAIYLAAIQTHKLKHFSVIDAPYLLDAIGNWKGLVKFFWGLPRAWWWCWQTLRELKSRFPRVICYWPGFSDRLVFSPLAKYWGCRLIWIEIGPLEPTFGHNWGFPRWLYNSVKHLPDHFTTTSLFTKTSMVKTGHIPANKITLIYPSITLRSRSEISRSRRLGHSWLNKNKLKNQTIITWVGRLASENEVELVIEALAQLQKRGEGDKYRVHLIIIGDGPEKARYQQLAKKLSITKKITFTGFISEETKFSIMAASDLFVFTRAWELDGFGMTTIEAMSVGVPVVTSDFGPQREIVEEGKNGYLFAPHNFRSLAEVLAKMLNQPLQRKKLAQAGWQSLKKKFSQEAILGQVKKVIQS